jgi:glycosyltransferase involved in cell wall biosynthesis
MYREKTIGVVVPAYNEEKLIERTIRSMPEFIDRIVVVDDASTDATARILEQLAAGIPRLHIIRHAVNGGVGAAIRTGYAWCRDNGLDVAVVMAGDGQMDPNDLPALLDPVVEGRTDYAKGNRLVSGEAWKKIPRVRYLGNSALTFMTKIASGYWHMTDSQTGYTAIGRRALETIPIADIYPRYGMPNDLLVTLNIFNMRVMDVPVAPVYGIGEKSGFNSIRMIIPLFLLMIRLFSRRMIQKYIIRDFHPLILFYTFGFLILMVNIPLGVRLILLWSTQGQVPEMTALAILFCTILGFQSILFAMLFDMESNRDLKGR